MLKRVDAIEDLLRRVVRLAAGRPWPLGSTVLLDPGAVGEPAGTGLCGVNFAVWAPEATRVELCLFDDSGQQELQRLDLPACTDGVWHGWLAGVGEGCVYGYRAHGPWDPQRGERFNPQRVLLDPYAHEVVGRYAGELDRYVGHASGQPLVRDLRDNADIALKARVARTFRSDLLSHPQVPAAHTVLYEAHVKALTMRHPDVPPELRGSYAALGHPAVLAHLQSLGVTTLNLLPVHARADEARLQGLGLTNHWGYSTAAYFAPEPRYASQRPGAHAGQELREAIDALHAAGIEVVLDVVYNHTAETDEHGPTLSWRGLANARYYRLEHEDPQRYVNWAGCGNCLNFTEPRVVQMVLDSLRHWVLTYGVDGFRFDLASVLGRTRSGHFDRHGPFFAALQADPLLSRVKWIAEPWDIGPGGYQVGGFPPGWQEWNDRYRDAMRAFWLRGAGDRGIFAHRFAASSEQFHHSGRAPTASVNFITAHDGFTLRDLVSYDHKHNQANGEHNRDGHHHNSSWNCGVEGPSDDEQVLARRAQLQRALLATLLLSQGTPMLLAGDELGHSQGGNNNAYCQDNELTWLDWSGADRALQRYVARLLRLRRNQPALRLTDWLRGEIPPAATPRRHALASVGSELPVPIERPDVLWWHPDGRPMQGGDWPNEHDRALGIQLASPQHVNTPAALIVLQPDDRRRRFHLPPGLWRPVLCNLTDDGVPDETCWPQAGVWLDLPPRSLILMLDKSAASDEYLETTL